MKSLEISLLKWNIIQLRVIWKKIGMTDFVILDIDLPLSRYFLWSWDCSSHAPRYAILFFQKELLLLACFVVIKYEIFIWTLSFIWIQVHGCKYLQHYRRSVSSCKLIEEWPHLVLPCHNKSEKELVYMEWLIMDRQARAKLIILWKVCSSIQHFL